MRSIPISNTILAKKYTTYLMPAQIIFVDLEDVSDAKSPLSTQATFILPSREAASNATPAPVAPPPITRISYGESGVEEESFLICSRREVIPSGPGISFG